MKSVETPAGEIFCHTFTLPEPPDETVVGTGVAVDGTTVAVGLAVAVGGTAVVVGLVVAVGGTTVAVGLVVAVGCAPSVLIWKGGLSCHATTPQFIVKTPCLTTYLPAGNFAEFIRVTL